ncbi:serine protease inhibitor 1 [Capsicum chacoense]
MMKCLLLLCLCLLPFVAFSSNFTFENPIELPTVTSVGQRVFDPLGRAVETRRSYRISSSLWGALGGQVYLATTPNLAAPCPDGVFKYNSDSGPRGNCDSYTVWKCGDYDASLDATLLGTSRGTIGERDSSWFKLARAQQGYHLLNCPGPIACPSCVLEGCRAVWAITMPDGRRRLALARRQDPPQQLRFPLSVNFVRA